MGVKKERILKRDWESFLEDFNRDNRFRAAVVRLKDNVLEGDWGRPFIGINYDPEERVAKIYLGVPQPDDPIKPVYEVKVPRAFWQIVDGDDTTKVLGIQIQPKPGEPMVYITFEDIAPEEVKNRWLQEMAYALYLKRGMEHGKDQEDWFTAENIVEEAINNFS